jgi:hypothetical protein
MIKRLLTSILTCVCLVTLQNETKAATPPTQPPNMTSWVCVTNNFDFPVMLLLMPRRPGIIARSTAVLLPNIMYPPQPTFAPFLFIKIRPGASAVAKVDLYNATSMRIIGQHNAARGTIVFNTNIEGEHVLNCELGLGNGYTNGIKLTPVSQELIDAIDAAPSGPKPSHEQLSTANHEEILV